MIACAAAAGAGGVICVPPGCPKGSQPPVTWRWSPSPPHKLSRLLTQDPVTSSLRARFTEFKGTSGEAELGEVVRPPRGSAAPPGAPGLGPARFDRRRGLERLLALIVA